MFARNGPWLVSCGKIPVAPELHICRMPQNFNQQSYSKQETSNVAVSPEANSICWNILLLANQNKDNIWWRCQRPRLFDSMGEASECVARQRVLSNLSSCLCSECSASVDDPMRFMHHSHVTFVEFMNLCSKTVYPRWEGQVAYKMKTTSPKDFTIKLALRCPELRLQTLPGVCIRGLHLAPFEWVNSMMCRPDMFVEDTKKGREMGARWSHRICPRQIVQKPPEEGGVSPSSSDSSAMPYDFLTKSMKAFALNC